MFIISKIMSRMFNKQNTYKMLQTVLKFMFWVISLYSFPIDTCDFKYLGILRKRIESIIVTLIVWV